MVKRLRFIKFHTQTVYFGNSDQVISFVKEFQKLKRFPISRKFGDIVVNVTFFPSRLRIKRQNFRYSIRIDAALTGPNGYSAYIQLFLLAEIENSQDWDVSKFKSYLYSSTDNTVAMAAPALRKITHLFYTLFSSDRIDGEVYVPDMVDVFNAKVKREFKNK